MTAERTRKLLTVAGMVLLVVVILSAIRVNEGMDRREGRAAYANEAAQCSASCESSYSTARRRCSAYSYDGTQDWCRDQARSVRSSCISRCPR
jgi:hypothetical protein